MAAGGGGGRHSPCQPPERTRSAGDRQAGQTPPKNCGLTLDALGERVGLSASAVSLIETGKREAKVSTLAALAEALDCRLSDLLTEAHEPACCA